MITNTRYKPTPCNTHESSQFASEKQTGENTHKILMAPFLKNGAIFENVLVEYSGNILGVFQNTNFCFGPHGAISEYFGNILKHRLLGR